MSINPLVGTWRLVYHEIRATDGTLSHPYGLDAQAIVTYTADGYMGVHVMSANRPMPPTLSDTSGVSETVESTRRRLGRPRQAVSDAIGTRP